MHEFSIMSQVVQAILVEVEKNKLKMVSKVLLEVGDLTFLGEEQLRFCYEVLSKDNVLAGSELVIEKIEPEVECAGCGYHGNLEYLEADEFHFRLPKFTCPKCDSNVEIIKGKDCTIREISGET
ncbi:hydrogenase maturation nickel metallochaperone HypA [[Eubacterium] cellulosolvens]